MVTKTQLSEHDRIAKEARDMMTKPYKVDSIDAASKSREAGIYLLRIAQTREHFAMAAVDFLNAENWQYADTKFQNREATPKERKEIENAGLKSLYSAASRYSEKYQNMSKEERNILEQYVKDRVSQVGNSPKNPSGSMAGRTEEFGRDL